MARMTISIDQERIRGAFPALAGDAVFLENAGGSQVPRVVADRIRDYMLETYVQLGAGYALSKVCTQTVADAHTFVNRLMNGPRGHVILGSSTTALLRMLSECYMQLWRPGQEIILAETGHEANVGPWARLADQGLIIRWWHVNRETCACPLDRLEELLSPRTVLVAFPHVSNLLGAVTDVRAVTTLAHAAGTRVVVDGVAYAPHRAIDVDTWDVDWYVYSTYKVYGPHMAALYGRADAVAELSGPNHFFIPRDEVPYKFELGGASHEAAAGVLALGEYLAWLAGVSTGGDCDRRTIERAFEIMTACERPVQQRLIAYLRSKPGVRIIGPLADDDCRVSTVSFVHERVSSRAITAAVDGSGIAIRHGNMYAYRLCQALGLDVDDGVVRISAVHYNTPAEIDRLINVLERLF